MKTITNSLFLLMFFFLIPGDAWSTTHYADKKWPIRGEFPTLDISMGDESYSSTQAIYYCDDDEGDADECEDLTVTSSWPEFATCSIDETNGVVLVSFDAEQSDWPSASEWASNGTVTCTVSNGTTSHDIVVTIVAREDDIPVTSPHTVVNLLGGVAFHKLKNTTYAQNNRLPPGDYTSEIVNAKLASGADWPGVRCNILDGDDASGGNNHDWVSVDVALTTSPFIECITGCYCTVEEDGTDYNLPVRIDEVSSASEDPCEEE